MILSQRTVLYLIYSIVLVAVLIFFRFPEEKFRNYIEWKIDNKFTQTSCHIGKIKYRPPFSILLSDIVFKGKDVNPSPQTKIQRIRLSISLFRIWRDIRFKGDFGSGTFQGSANCSSSIIPRNCMIDSFSGDGVNCASFLSPFTDRKISGTLLLQMTRDTDATNQKMIWRGHADVTNGTVALMNPLFSLEKIQFDRLSAKLDYSDSVITLSQGVINGRDITTSFSGALTVRQPLSSSPLKIDGEADFTHTFLVAHPKEAIFIQSLKTKFQKNTVPYKIDGVLNKPSIIFD